MTKKKNTDYLDDLISEFNLESDDANETAPKETENFAELLDSSLKATSRKISVGDKIQGKILLIGKDEAYVSIGGQHDGVMSRKDLLDAEGNCPHKSGDTIAVYVTMVRGSEIRVSTNPTDRNIAEGLVEAYEAKMAIPGRVVEICKGGVRVNIKGKIAFCPISQLDTKRIETADEYVGKSFDFKITKFEEGGRNIVVSRRKLLEEDQEKNSTSFLEEHPDGSIAQGRVVRLEKYGAFIELAPGVDGLAHISEIAWSRIGEPAEVLQLNQMVSVKLLKRERVGDKMKIALSIKQAMSEADAKASRNTAAAAAVANDPWSKFTVGQVVKGKITKKEPFGLFIQLEPGITGLLHKSRTIEASDFHIEKLRVNDEITVQIGQISREERRISLDLPRDGSDDDWKSHVQTDAPSLGSLGGAFGDKLKAALAKKK